MQSGRFGGTPEVLIRGTGAEPCLNQRRRPESNWCKRLCRPLRSHSATAPGKCSGESRRQMPPGPLSRGGRPTTSVRLPLVLRIADGPPAFRTAALTESGAVSSLKESALMSPARRLVVPALAAALALSLPGAALARGGGGGGGGGGATTPPPVESTFTCDFSGDGVLADGSSIFTNQAGTAGCVTVKATAGSLSLYNVVDNSAEGWSHVVNSGGGTQGRVDVTFTNSITRQTISARIEPGKTRIG